MENVLVFWVFPPHFSSDLATLLLPDSLGTSVAMNLDGQSCKHPFAFTRFFPHGRTSENSWLINSPCLCSLCLSSLAAEFFIFVLV